MSRNRKRNHCDISLYAIIDPEHVQGKSSPDALAQLALAAAKSGATIMQYRDKRNDKPQQIENVTAIMAALSETRCPLLINDHVDVALATGAQGVHLGQDDGSIEEARKALPPGAIIGQSIKLLQHAYNAPMDALDYVCIGGVFDTSSKDNKTSIGIEGWKALAAIFRSRAPDLPIGGIAGIGSSNAASLIAAGADGVAVISAIFMADDVEAATRELASTIDRARMEA